MPDNAIYVDLGEAVACAGREDDVGMPDRTRIERRPRVYLASVFVLLATLELFAAGLDGADGHWVGAVVFAAYASLFAWQAWASIRAVDQPRSTPTDPDVLEAQFRRRSWLILGSAGVTLTYALIAHAPIGILVAIPASLVVLAIFVGWATRRVAGRLRDLPGPPAIVTPGPPGACTVVISRTARFRDGLRVYRALIDGTIVGKIPNGGAISVPVAAGDHTVQVRIDFLGSQTFGLHASPSGHIELLCEPNLSDSPAVDFFGALFGLRPWLRLEDVTNRGDDVAIDVTAPEDEAADSARTSR